MNRRTSRRFHDSKKEYWYHFLKYIASFLSLLNYMNTMCKEFFRMRLYYWLLTEVDFKREWIRTEKTEVRSCYVLPLTVTTTYCFVILRCISIDFTSSVLKKCITLFSNVLHVDSAIFYIVASVRHVLIALDCFIWCIFVVISETTLCLNVL